MAAFSRRKLFQTLAALALGSALTACGSGEESGGPGTVTIRYARWGLPQEIAAERELLREFEAANPDVKVELEFNSWAEYWNKLQAQMAANTAPDVFLVNGGYMHEYASRDQLQDLNAKVEGDPDINLDAYFPPVLDMVRWEGSLWAMPRDCNTIGIFYNKNLFDRHGIAYPEPGWTWEDFLEKARALTKDEDGDGRPESFGYLASFESMEVHYASWIWQNGGGILNEAHTAAVIDEPAAVEAMEFYTSLVTKEEVSPDMAQASTFGSNMFLTGRLAMSSEGSWMLRAFSEIDHFEWGIAPLPTGKQQVAPVNGLGNAVYAKSKNPDAAWRLAKFLASRSYQEQLAKSGTSIPALKEVAYSDIYLDGSPPGKTFFLEQIETGRTLDFVPGFARIEDAIRGELELVWLGQKEVGPALTDAAAKVDEILAGDD